MTILMIPFVMNLWAKAPDMETIQFNLCAQEKLALIAVDSGKKITAAEKNKDKKLEKAFLAERRQLIDCYNYWWDQEIEWQNQAVEIPEQVQPHICEQKMTDFLEVKPVRGKAKVCLKNFMKLYPENSFN